MCLARNDGTGQCSDGRKPFWQKFKCMFPLLSYFHGCLRKICYIFWPKQDLEKGPLYLQKNWLPERCHQWNSNVDESDGCLTYGESIRLVSLRSGRPKTTWSQTVMAELSEVKLTWGGAQHAVQKQG